MPKQRYANWRCSDGNALLVNECARQLLLQQFSMSSTSGVHACASSTRTFVRHPYGRRRLLPSRNAMWNHQHKHERQRCTIYAFSIRTTPHTHTQEDNAERQRNNAHSACGKPFIGRRSLRVRLCCLCCLCFVQKVTFMGEG